MIKFTIPGEPHTKKNSQRILISRNGKRFIAPSEKFLAYQELCGYYLRPRPKSPLDEPLNLQCVFYLGKNLRSDLVNYEEAICDILVHYGIIADDRWQIIRSMDGSHCEVDRENPRTEIRITSLEESEA